MATMTKMDEALESEKQTQKLWAEAKAELKASYKSAKAEADKLAKIFSDRFAEDINSPDPEPKKGRKANEKATKSPWTFEQVQSLREEVASGKDMKQATLAEGRRLYGKIKSFPKLVEEGKTNEEILLILNGSSKRAKYRSQIVS
jgi:head-tail adaptor